jgi:hypothetical protein
MLLSFSFPLSFASLSFSGLQTPHTQGNVGYTPFFWTNQEERSIYLSRRAELRATKTTKDGSSVGSMRLRGGEFTRNDPTAWTSLFLSFLSPFGPFLLLLVYHPFPSFSFLPTSKIPYLLCSCSVIYIGNLCVYIYTVDSIFC